MLKDFGDPFPANSNPSVSKAMSGLPAITHSQWQNYQQHIEHWEAQNPEG